MYNGRTCDVRLKTDRHVSDRGLLAGLDNSVRREIDEVTVEMSIVQPNQLQVTITSRNRIPTHSWRRTGATRETLNLPCTQLETLYFNVH